MEEKKTHRQIVTAIGHDGNETYVLSMVFEMNQGVDIIQAVKEAMYSQLQ